ncbi:molybdopterin-binding protein [Oricola sp.]|uniref:molybdopterin-binding protein n=1 Tax=Oricola sp. TaxID=1979950 RepID=UPI0025EEAD80|nr:molybdopterin-binding protein [Oricola sp.]MCI5075453.1 molybdopterin-binding protein [Oricola sp.]
MWFGTRPLDGTDALVGSILAHSLLLAPGRKLRKGHALTSGDLSAMRSAGVEAITVAVPEAGDILEDEAAGRIADVFALDGFRREDVGTGRVNFHAEADGVLVVAPDRIDALNRIDPAITLATLPNHAHVRSGQMVATVKIIPFAVAGSLVETAVAEVRQPATIAVRPFRAGLKVAVVQTRVKGTKASVLDKTCRVTEARLTALSATLASESRTDHVADDLSAEIAARIAEADMVLVFGASAVTDRRDVVPQAIEKAGGSILHVGMPVDPGNLLVLGEIDGKPVIGAPGCARSPKENGFDWVLQRLCAGIAVTGEDIVAMGVGGLLTEIPVRPHPRETARPVDRK